MPGQYNGQIKSFSAQAAREIKASAHYAYIVDGITLDGSKFPKAGLVLEGQCLVRNTTTKKFEPYTAGALTAGTDTPVIMDTSVKFDVDANGDNYDTIIGALLVHGAVYESMLIGVDQDFKDATPQIRYVAQ